MFAEKILFPLFGKLFSGVYDKAGALTKEEAKVAAMEDKKRAGELWMDFLIPTSGFAVFMFMAFWLYYSVDTAPAMMTNSCMILSVILGLIAANVRLPRTAEEYLKGYSFKVWAARLFLFALFLGFAAFDRSSGNIPVDTVVFFVIMASFVGCAVYLLSSKGEMISG